jgi:hypothetical protein
LKHEDGLNQEEGTVIEREQLKDQHGFHEGTELSKQKNGCMLVVTKYQLNNMSKEKPTYRKVAESINW